MILAGSTSYSQDSVFVIRSCNIKNLDKRIEVDTPTFDSLLLHKPLFVCIEPINTIARLYHSNKSIGHLYPVCYYDEKDRNMLTLRYFRLNDVETEDIRKTNKMPAIETTGNYMSCSTLSIPNEDVEFYYSKDTVVSLWNFSSLSIETHNVEYKYFKIKDIAIKKYQNLNFCHFLNVEIGDDRYCVVSFLIHNIMPIQKAVRKGCLLIDNDNTITTIKVKDISTQ